MYFIGGAESIIVVVRDTVWFSVCVDTNPFESKHFHDIALPISPVVVELLFITLPQLIVFYCRWQ